MANNNKIIQESVNDTENNLSECVNVFNKNSFENILKYIGGLIIDSGVKNIARC